MILSIITALSANQVIGLNNQLPWHLPADLQHFKAHTLGKPIIMGRKTYESLGKPLPGRRNIVVTHNAQFHAPGCEIVNSLEQALKLTAKDEEVMVIGGAELIQQVLPQTDRLYLTFIHEQFEGNCFFPAWNPADWLEIEREDYKADARNPHPYSFVTYQRKLCHQIL